MTNLFKFITVLMFTVLTSSLFFTGCSHHQPPVTETLAPLSTTDQTFPLTMYVKEEVPGFIKGSSVTVLSINGPLAMTQNGEIPLSNLEEQRSSFRLTIHTLDAATVRILNIKPKYYDGIWLSPGKYHIEISKPGYRTYRQWVEIGNDTALEIKLEKSAFKPNGSVTWQKKSNLFSSNGLIWYNNDDEKMTWQQADSFCNDLNVTLYGYRLQDFALPRDTELLQLSGTIRVLQSQNILYWSSTTDEEHQSYAKYVNVNSAENSWYKKHGKTYVMCAEPINYPQAFSIQQLASALIEHNALLGASFAEIQEDLSENEQALNAYEMALFIKYGDPIVQNVVYHADTGRLIFELISQNSTKEGKPLYRREVTLEVEAEEAEQMQKQLMDPAFEPIVEFEVNNGQLQFIGL